MAATSIFCCTGSLVQLNSMKAISASRAPSIGAFFPLKARPIQRRRRQLTVFARGGGSEDTEIAERVVAASAYLLPLLDGVQYGRYFLIQFPAAQLVLEPIYPLLRIYSATPFASVAVFFGLYFLVVRSPNFSRYVRFNTMQAIVLDVLLIVPNLVEGTFHPRDGLGLEALIIFYNTVFLFLLTCFVVGSGSCLIGRTPRLPLVADAADAQVM